MIDSLTVETGMIPGLNIESTWASIVICCTECGTEVIRVNTFGNRHIDERGTITAHCNKHQP